MPILFACIFTSNIIIQSSNDEIFTNVVTKLYSLLDLSINAKKTYKEQYIINILINDNIAFICFSTLDFPMRISFSYLECIMKLYPRNDIKHEMNKFMNYFSNDISVDQIRYIQDQINQVKNIMHDNIEKMLKRGENIEILVEKSKELEENSFIFAKNTKQLKHKMICNNIKTYIWLIILFCITLGVSGLILYIFLH